MLKLEDIANKTSVAFDPGLSPFFEDISSTYNTVGELLSTLPSFSRKQKMFTVYAPKIAGIFKNNVCFYKGCLAWAFYIKKEFPNAKIKGNIFAKNDIGFSPAEYVDFLIEAVDDFTSNLKYYGIKGALIPENIKNTLKTYRDFIVINGAFSNVLSVDDLHITEGYSPKFTPGECADLILKSVNSKNISLLADL